MSSNCSLPECVSESLSQASSHFSADRKPIKPPENLSRPYFFIKSSTADVMPLIAVRIVGSGTGQ